MDQDNRNWTFCHQAGSVSSCGYAPTLPLALTRQTIRAQVNRAEMMLIESKAQAAGLSVANYIRSLLGLPERSAG